MRVTSFVVAAVAAICFACGGNEGGKTIAGEGTHGKAVKTAGNEGPHGAPTQVAGENGVRPAPAKAGGAGVHPAQVAGKNGGNGRQGQGGVKPAPKTTLASIAH
jgi:hypothetical protein